MTNEQAFIEAKSLIPGGVNSPVRAYKSVNLTPRFIASASGAYISDIEGNKYLDFVQSYGPAILGHANASITAAICEAAKAGCSYGAPTLAESNLAKAVLKHYQSQWQIRFVNSGTEATMSAIRLARAASQKDGLLKFDGCYHGHADALLINAGSGCSTYGAPSSAGVPASATSCTFSAVYNDINSVEAAFKTARSLNNPIGVVIIEPIAGNMGFVPAEKSFLQELKKLCAKEGAILIFDEVMSGFRAALGGAKEVYDICPDMVCFGKVIGAGLPVGAYAASKEIMANLSPLGNVYQAGTLSGNPLAMAAGLTAMNALNPELYERLGALGNYLISELKAIAAKKGVPFVAQNIGSMFGFFFLESYPKNFADVQKSSAQAFMNFFKVCLEGGINLAPSLYETSFLCSSMTEADMDKFIKVFSKAIEYARN